VDDGERHYQDVSAIRVVKGLVARQRAADVIGVVPSVGSMTLLRPVLETLPFPLNDGRARLVGDARRAWLWVLATLLETGEETLVPTYASHELLSALAARAIQCRWYCTHPGATPDTAGLDAALVPRTRAVVLSHPLGYSQDAQPWRDWCDRRGLLLLEDAAHALHATSAGGPVGRQGHAAVFQLPPVLGTPNGAVVVMTSARPSEPEDSRAAFAAEWTLLQRWRALLSRRLYDEIARARQPSGAAPTTVSPSTVCLLSILADEANASRRRTNYRALLERLGDRMPPGWSDLPSGSSPLVFPVRDADPPGLLERLGSHRIRSWPLFARSPMRDDALGLDGCIGLPVHQELQPSELDRIVEATASPAALHRHRAAPSLEYSDDLGSLRDEWAELALRAGNPFATWQWASVWWRIFGGGKNPMILAQRRPNGTLLGILALYHARRRPIRVARVLGHGPADELGPICDPSDRAEFGWALRRFMMNRRLPWDVVLADRMPVEEGWSSALGGVLLKRESSPSVMLDGLDWEQFLRLRSRNFREQVRRRERRLQREYAVRYRLVAEPERLEAELDLLFELHRARWKGESSVLTANRERFHREWAAAAQDAGWLRLWFLELDGKTVAAWYGLRYAQRDFFYQAGRDPAFDDRSVGFVLLAHTIRAAANDGIREYRLLRGGEPYKARFATRDRSLETRAIAGSSAGAAAVAGAAAAATSGARGLLKAAAERS
jgi:CelD/BcsL family acetyltransferase involved in cellulose biosynthesis